MIRSEFMSALKQVASERGISVENVLETLKQAMIAAYRKDYPEQFKDIEETEEGKDGETIKVEVNRNTGEVRLEKNGEDVTPPGFGRIAAQTAKQVILQGVREAEKVAVLEEFRGKLGKVVSGVLQRQEHGSWLVDVGRAVVLMPKEEQVYREEYRPNKRLRVLVKEIHENEGRGEVIVSRTDNNLIRALFEIEVPEVQNKSVEIKSIAREVGSRAKIAVASTQPGVDPVGSMVGQRGVRVQAVTDELQGEKIDIILWSGDPSAFIINALAPAQVIDVTIKEADKTARVEVKDDQLSLAIGKEGQNVRLASKLSGYKIDIIGELGKKVKVEAPTAAAKADADTAELKELGLSTRIVNNLAKSGITTAEQLKLLTPEQLETTPGIGPKAVEEIQQAVA